MEKDGVRAVWKGTKKYEHTLPLVCDVSESTYTKSTPPLSACLALLMMLKALATADNHGQSRATTGTHRQPQTTTGNHRQLRATTTPNATPAQSAQL